MYIVCTVTQVFVVLVSNNFLAFKKQVTHLLLHEVELVADNKPEEDNELEEDNGPEEDSCRPDHLDSESHALMEADLIKNKNIFLLQLTKYFLTLSTLF